MRGHVGLGLFFLLSTIAGCFGVSSHAESEPPRTFPAAKDVVVVAVVDSNINPYHFDFLAEFMPQHLNDNASDDLPLDVDPSTWVPGYPNATTFESFEALDLTLTNKSSAKSEAQYNKDKKAWGKLEGSDADVVHMAWVPGTKVIGLVTFTTAETPSVFSPSSHGVGTASVSVGNFHGTCPHCLLVYVDGTSEVANEWVAQQDWIDLQTNSWGLSTTGARDRVYAGSDTELQRTAVDRGQSIFFSAGNGIGNAFAVSNPTLFSSQEGPDWITTVGAILRDGSTTGAGRPADVAAPGQSYPSAYNESNVGAGHGLNETGEFGGTSSATPVTAGLFAEALHRLRRDMADASRTQTNGIVATGPAGCGTANADCALADGNLTVHELREALYRSAQYNGKGYSPYFPRPLPLDPMSVPATETQREALYLGAGHGSYWGLLKGPVTYQAEVERIVGYARGSWFTPQDVEQAAWFVADSVCRQAGWGAWQHGYAQKGLAAPTASAQWPVRTWLHDECPDYLPRIVEAEKDLPRSSGAPA